MQNGGSGRGLPLGVFFEAGFEEVDVLLYVLVVRIGTLQGLSFIVQKDIERLGVGAELHALEVAPLVADGAQSDVLTVLADDERLGQAGLVIDIEGDEDVFLTYEPRHGRVAPNGQLHLPAVHAAVTGEVNKHRLAHTGGIGHPGVVILELGFDLRLTVEVEILRRHRRRKGAHGLQRRSPQTRHHVDGKGQRHEAEEETGHTGVRRVVVMRKLQLAQQVETQQGKDDDPKRKERLAVKQVPAIGQVGHGKELQGKRQLHEAERHLDHVHPASTLRGAFQPCGEKGEECERQGKGDGKAQHTDGRRKNATRRAHLDEKETDDRPRARKRNERQRESHKEDAQQAGRSLSLAVDLVAPR